MVLAVGIDQIHIAVAVQIILKNPLQNTLFGNVNILTAVAEGAAAEGFKAFGDPCFLHSKSLLTDCEVSCQIR